MGKAVQIYALSPKGARDAQGIRKSDRESHVEDLPCATAALSSLTRSFDRATLSRGQATN